MTRALHKATRVQRGDRTDVSTAARARGYEASEAPAARVALGVAAFVAVMFVGMGAGALVVDIGSGARPSSVAAAGERAQQPPPPRLLAHPERERREIEGAAKRRLAAGALPIDRAMARVARRGWGEDAPAPPSREIARDHADAAR